jgi:thiamine biosynthesis protein ThiS
MSISIQIQVNGQTRDAVEGQTIADLLHELDLKSERVAVELNLEIVDRQRFPTCRLRQDDRVEIISFIGGGTEELTH